MGNRVKTFVRGGDVKGDFLGVPSGAAGSDTIVTAAATQTLTNKTLTSPILTSATLTLPVLETVRDSNSTNRLIINPTAKTIVDGSATSLFEVACTTGQMVGGLVFFLVRASDATDHQAIAGMMSYSGVNKAGTITADETYATANEAKSTSSGTLTLAWTAVDSTNKITVKLQPTGSLTETTYTLEYTIVPIRGAVTIL